MKLKHFLEAGIMLAGLILVLITLSGQTQRIGIMCTAASLILFLAKESVKDDKE
jgi:hypothetical protein